MRDQEWEIVIRMRDWDQVLQRGSVMISEVSRLIVFSNRQLYLLDIY